MGDVAKGPTDSTEVEQGALVIAAPVNGNNGNHTTVGEVGCEDVTREKSVPRPVFGPSATMLKSKLERVKATGTQGGLWGLWGLWGRFTCFVSEVK